MRIGPQAGRIMRKMRNLLNVDMIKILQPEFALRLPARQKIRVS